MSFDDRRDDNVFKKGIESFMHDPVLPKHGEETQNIADVVPNNNIIVGENRTVFQQLDAGNNVSRSVSHIQITPSLSAKKAVTNGEQATNSLSAGKQEVTKITAAMRESWAQNKAQAIECLKEAANNRGFNGDAVINQICSSGINENGLGSMVTANSTSSPLEFGISKQDKKLKPEELKALIKDTVEVARSHATRDTRVNNVFSAPPQPTSPPPSYDIAKLDEKAMEALLTEDLEDQPEYKAALNVEHALNEVAKNHQYVSRHYNPTDVAESEYDSIDVELAGQALRGISSIKIDSYTGLGANTSDITSIINNLTIHSKSSPDYKPPEPMLYKTLGIG